MQAWHMFPTCGMPWNQIGSLVSSNYHGVGQSFENAVSSNQALRKLPTFSSNVHIFEL